MCDQMADHRIPDERQIANRVQDLVTNEFVFETQGGVQLDDAVVDAERGERREEMLDGLDGHRFAGEPGRETDPPEMRDGGRNLQAAEIRALEPDAEISRRGLEGQRDLVPRMKTDSGA